MNKRRGQFYVYLIRGIQAARIVSYAIFILLPLVIVVLMGLWFVTRLLSSLVTPVYAASYTITSTAAKTKKNTIPGDVPDLGTIGIGQASSEVYGGAAKFDLSPIATSEAVSAVTLDYSHNATYDRTPFTHNIEVYRMITDKSYDSWTGWVADPYGNGSFDYLGAAVMGTQGITLDATKIEAMRSDNRGIYLVCPDCNNEEYLTSYPDDTDVVTLHITTSGPTPTPTTSPSPTPTPFPNGTASAQLNYGNVTAIITLTAIEGHDYNYTSRVTLINGSTKTISHYYTDPTSGSPHYNHWGTNSGGGSHSILPGDSEVVETAAPTYFWWGEPWSLWVQYSDGTASTTNLYVNNVLYSDATGSVSNGAGGGSAVPIIPTTCDTLDIWCQAKQWVWGVITYIFGVNQGTLLQLSSLEDLAYTKVPWAYLSALSNIDLTDPPLATPGSAPDVTLPGIDIPYKDVNANTVTHHYIGTDTAVLGSTWDGLNGFFTGVRNGLKVILIISFIVTVVRTLPTLI